MPAADPRVQTCTDLSPRVHTAVLGHTFRAPGGPPRELRKVFLDDLDTARMVLARTPSHPSSFDPDRVVQLSFTGLPAYTSPDARPEPRELDWAQAVVDGSVALLSPPSSIAAAVLHRSGSSPRVRVLAVPCSSEGVVGWHGLLSQVHRALADP